MYFIMCFLLSGLWANIFAGSGEEQLSDCYSAENTYRRLFAPSTSISSIPPEAALEAAKLPGTPLCHRIYLLENLLRNCDITDPLLNELDIIMNNAIVSIEDYCALPENIERSVMCLEVALNGAMLFINSAKKLRDTKLMEGASKRLAEKIMRFNPSPLILLILSEHMRSLNFEDLADSADLLRTEMYVSEMQSYNFFNPQFKQSFEQAKTLAAESLDWLRKNFSSLDRDCKITAFKAIHQVCLPFNDYQRTVNQYFIDNLTGFLKSQAKFYKQLERFLETQAKRNI